MNIVTYDVSKCVESNINQNQNLVKKYFRRQVPLPSVYSS